MPLGPGKYDLQCSEVRIATEAAGVILLIIGGNKGTGFSVQANLEVTLKLPEILRIMANEIERSTTL